MSDARRSDGILSAGHVHALLSAIAGLPDADVPLAVVARNLQVRHGALPLRTSNAVQLLKGLGILRLNELSVGITPLATEHSQAWPRLIAEATAAELVRRIAGRNLVGCVSFSGVHRSLWVDSQCTPGTEDGLLRWALEFGVLRRQAVGDRMWEIDARYEPLFHSMLREWNERLLGRRSTAVAFRRRRERNAEQGELAEGFVVGWERSRLTGHPALDQVKSIASDHVGEGYDVLSFSTQNALVHDLFIEVKSFSGNRRFFWTANEVDVARTLGERYAIYLVDVGAMNLPAYHPDVIRGPYAALIQTGLPGWSMRAATYEFIHTTGEMAVTQPMPQ